MGGCARLGEGPSLGGGCWVRRRVRAAGRGFRVSGRVQGQQWGRHGSGKGLRSEGDSQPVGESSGLKVGRF